MIFLRKFDRTPKRYVLMNFTAPALIKVMKMAGYNTTCEPYTSRKCLSIYTPQISL